MKRLRSILVAILVFVIGLNIGCALSAYFGFRWVNTHITDSVSHGQEVGEEIGATYAAEAVKCIDEGDTQRAVRFLSVPIAHYWVSCAVNAGTNSEILRTRSYIEQRASTNPIVAAQIKRDELGSVGCGLLRN